VVTKDGSQRWVGTARDITGRQDLEQQLLHAQKMEAVGRLAGGVAHDFNNLLTAIFSFVDFALEGLPDDHPATEDLREVIRAAERARDLTGQLLAFSRRKAVAPQVVDINELITTVEPMLVRVISDDIRYELDLTASPYATRIDPGAFEQVLVNLIVNASDAMPLGGRVTVETKNVTLQPSDIDSNVDLRPGDYVALSVSDTGPGIAPEERPHIFEPFFTTKGPGRGTGLGLSTCYGIAKQADGDIVVSDREGGGAVFTVLLPRVEEEDAAAMPTRPASEASGGEETILVVEDDAQVRSLTVRVLENLGYTVLEASDGAHAFEIMENHPGAVHLLITDVVMPDVSGRALADRFEQEHPAGRVLFVSGYGEHVVAERGVLNDGIHMLRKPFNPKALASAVRDTLETDLETTLH
jgi:nitrogen-specific signal transduction histidine kinase/CheY-like chemotaxis protein